MTFEEEYSIYSNGEALGNTVSFEDSENDGAIFAKRLFFRGLLTLNEEEREFLMFRFGLMGTPKTLSEMGEKYNISREDAKAFETRALFKLRKFSAMDFTTKKDIQNATKDIKKLNLGVPAKILEHIGLLK